MGLKNKDANLERIIFPAIKMDSLNEIYLFISTQNYNFFIKY